MAVENFALDRAKSLMLGSNSTPSPVQRAAIASSGSSGLLASPSDSFTPSSAGAAGGSSSVPRNAERRKDLLEGLVPLYFSGEAYAVIQMTADAGGGGSSATFEKFLLTNVRENNEERFQIFETFRDPLIYFMDKAPQIYSFSGFLPAAPDNAGVIWADAFMNYYEETLRGTRAVENNVRACISYNSVIAIGYVLNARLGQESEVESKKEFSFDMFITAARRLGG